MAASLNSQKVTADSVEGFIKEHTTRDVDGKIQVNFATAHDAVKFFDSIEKTIPALGNLLKADYPEIFPSGKIDQLNSYKIFIEFNGFEYLPLILQAMRELEERQQAEGRRRASSAVKVNFVSEFSSFDTLWDTILDAKKSGLSHVVIVDEDVVKQRPGAQYNFLSGIEHYVDIGLAFDIELLNRGPARAKLEDYKEDIRGACYRFPYFRLYIDVYPDGRRVAKIVRISNTKVFVYSPGKFSHDSRPFGIDAEEPQDSSIVIIPSEDICMVKLHDPKGGNLEGYIVFTADGKISYNLRWENGQSGLRVTRFKGQPARELFFIYDRAKKELEMRVPQEAIDGFTKASFPVEKELANGIKWKFVASSAIRLPEVEPRILELIKSGSKDIPEDLKLAMQLTEVDFVAYLRERGVSIASLEAMLSLCPLETDVSALRASEDWESLGRFITKSGIWGIVKRDFLPLGKDKLPLQEVGETFISNKGRNYLEFLKATLEKAQGKGPARRSSSPLELQTKVTEVMRLWGEEEVGAKTALLILDQGSAITNAAVQRIDEFRKAINDLRPFLHAEINNDVLDVLHDIVVIFGRIDSRISDRSEVEAISGKLTIIQRKLSVFTLGKGFPAVDPRVVALARSLDVSEPDTLKGAWDEALVNYGKYLGIKRLTVGNIDEMLVAVRRNEAGDRTALAHLGYLLEVSRLSNLLGRDFPNLDPLGLNAGMASDFLKQGGKSYLEFLKSALEKTQPGAQGGAASSAVGSHSANRISPIVNDKRLAISDKPKGASSAVKASPFSSEELRNLADTLSLERSERISAHTVTYYLRPRDVLAPGYALVVVDVVGKNITYVRLFSRSDTVLIRDLSGIWWNKSPDVIIKELAVVVAKEEDVSNKSGGADNEALKFASSAVGKVALSRAEKMNSLRAQIKSLLDQNFYTISELASKIGIPAMKIYNAVNYGPLSRHIRLLVKRQYSPFEHLRGLNLETLSEEASKLTDQDIRLLEQALSGEYNEDMIYSHIADTGSDALIKLVARPFQLDEFSPDIFRQRAKLENPYLTWKGLCDYLTNIVELNRIARIQPRSEVEGQGSVASLPVHRTDEAVVRARPWYRKEYRGIEKDALLRFIKEAREIPESMSKAMQAMREVYGRYLVMSGVKKVALDGLLENVRTVRDRPGSTYLEQKELGSFIRKSDDPIALLIRKDYPHLLEMTMVTDDTIARTFASDDWGGGYYLEFLKSALEKTQPGAKGGAASSAVGSHSANRISPIVNDKRLTISDKPKGGIDFVTMPIKFQPMGSFNNLNVSLPRIANLEKFNLDSRIEHLKGIVRTGSTPLGKEFKEVAAACIYLGKMDDYRNDLIQLLAAVCQKQETELIETDSSLKETIVIVDNS